MKILLKVRGRCTVWSVGIIVSVTEAERSCRVNGYVVPAVDSDVNFVDVAVAVVVVLVIGNVMSSLVVDS